MVLFLQSRALWKLHRPVCKKREEEKTVKYVSLESHKIWKSLRNKFHILKLKYNQVLRSTFAFQILKIHNWQTYFSKHFMHSNWIGPDNSINKHFNIFYKLYHWIIFVYKSMHVTLYIYHVCVREFKWLMFRTFGSNNRKKIL